jgi:excisionase family DNA binding protein
MITENAIVGAFTIEEVARMLNVKEVTVRSWISRREIQSFKYLGRRYITPQQLKDFRRFRQSGEFIDMTYANGPSSHPIWR